MDVSGGGGGWLPEQLLQEQHCGPQLDLPPATASSASSESGSISRLSISFSLPWLSISLLFLSLFSLFSLFRFKLRETKPLYPAVAICRSQVTRRGAAEWRHRRISRPCPPFCCFI